jgi:serine protease Do
LIIFSSITGTVSADSSLTSDTLSLINDAVFEVVVPKPTDDSLTYEYPLPLNLIPYAVRTDKYYSIGTAFAIGPTEFVSAAHVMNLGTYSQFNEACLRDRDGNVFALDKITKYSEQRDFVVFTLKDKSVKEYFQVNTTTRTNQKVYAVGNALGEGVVIRDGLYTSSTPEAENGAWKWIRFSAPASPGNSGGPLLDKDGKVIGIVLKKSPSENLNYALPITEVIRERENLATAHRVITYSLDVMRTAGNIAFDKNIPLPKSYQDLNREIIDGINLHVYKTMKDLFRNNKKGTFPNGKGANIMLHSSYDTYFPNLIIQKEDGNWYASYPKEIKDAELPNNGHLRYGKIKDTYFIQLQKPDNITLESLYKEPKLFMDLILKGLYLSRKIGGQEDRIISFGKGGETQTFTDSYGRKWLINSWLIEYSDEKVVTFSLPVPGGLITMMRTDQTGLVNAGHIPDLKILANFIYLSFGSTLKNWREFMQMKDFLPLALSAQQIEFDNKKFSYRSKRFSFSCGSELMNVSDRTFLSLGFNYFKEKTKTIWDVTSVSVREEKNKSTYFTVRRRIKPAKDLNDTYQEEWLDLIEQKFPYNKAINSNDNNFNIATAINMPNNSLVCYTVAHGKDGKSEQTEMEKKLGNFLQTLTIHEYEARKEAAQDVSDNSYHDTGEYFRAVWGKDQVWEMHPRSADGYLLRGDISHDYEEVGQAMADYDKCIELYPEYAEGYYHRATAYQYYHAREQALADYSKAVGLDPKHAAAYYSRGTIYDMKGNFSQAIADYSKAIEVRPDSPEAYVGRGNSLAAKNEIDRAIADYNKAIEINPNHVLAFVNRGSQLLKKGDKDGTFKDFAKALEIDPMSAEAYNARGHVYYAMGESLNAITDLNKALEINPRYVKALNNRGITHARTGNIESAINDFNMALDLDSEDACSYNNRGFVFKVKGDLVRALADFDRAIKLNSKFVLAYINRGNTYALVMNKINACSDWRKACEEGTCTNYIKAKSMGACD